MVILILTISYKGGHMKRIRADVHLYINFEVIDSITEEDIENLLRRKLVDFFADQNLTLGEGEAIVDAWGRDIDLKTFC